MVPPLLLLALLHLPLAQAPSPPPRPAPDYAAMTEEAAQLLSRYLAIDTSNPPGNELAGAQLLAEALASVGVQAELFEQAPGRANLLARLPADKAEEGPLCLVSHIDVATAEPSTWPEGIAPFSGKIDEEGRIWGRGALDMKGLGIMELAVMMQMKRLGQPLRRDLVLLAVVDEEVDNQGVQYMVREHWDKLGCTHVLNEGGLGLKEPMFPGQDVFAISVGEKGVLWLRLVAEGRPGHGSTPQPDEAPTRLLDALQRVRAIEAQPNIHPAIMELFAIAGRGVGGAEGALLQRPWLARAVLEDKLMQNPLTAAAITDTIHITGLQGAFQPNVVPSEASALLDVRLLPGTSPQTLIDRITQAIDDPQVRIEVLQASEAAVSPWTGDPFYEALVRAATRAQPNVVAGPAISVGYTDSIYLRALGVHAYGFLPVIVDGAQAGTMHGAGEYLRYDQLSMGIRVLWEAVSEVTLFPPDNEP